MLECDPPPTEYLNEDLNCLSRLFVERVEEEVLLCVAITDGLP